MYGIVVTKMKYLVLGPVKAHTITLNPSIQPVQILIHSICIKTPEQLQRLKEQSGFEGRVQLWLSFDR